MWLLSDPSKSRSSRSGPLPPIPSSMAAAAAATRNEVEAAELRLTMGRKWEA